MESSDDLRGPRGPDRRAPDPALVALVAALSLTEPPVATLVGIGPGQAQFQCRADGLTLIAVLPAFVATPEGREAMATGLSNLSAPKVRLLLVGGSASLASELRKVREAVARPDLLLAALPEDGPLVSVTRAALPSDIRKRLDGGYGALDQTLDPGPVLAAAQRDSQQAQGDHQAFVHRMRTRKPVVTGVLAGFLAAIAVVSWWVGGWEDDGAGLLIAMGALVPDLAADEPWRVISAGLLHGGPVHIGMNAYVLWLIGGQLERIIGGGRMLALFTAGVIGGGVAAALTQDGGFMVGASSGVWALLVAQGWLGFFPGGLLPDAVVGIVKRNARSNLLINVLISFVPGISAAGHLGGGLAGGILAAAGVATRGLRADDDRGVSLVAPFQAALVAVSAVILGGGFAAALHHDKPWTLVEPLAWTTTPIENGALEIGIPAVLLAYPQELGDGNANTWGDLSHVPGLVSAQRLHLQPIPEGERQATLDQLVAELPDYTVEGWTPETGPALREADDHLVWERTLKAENGVTVTQVVVFFPFEGATEGLYIEVLSSPLFPGGVGGWVAPVVAPLISP
jgi:membrane associated rhomboid family serine protease